MMLITIVISLMCCQRPGTQHNENSDAHTVECSDGMKEARADLDKNTLGLYVFGLPSARQNMYVRILKEEYNIMLKGGGDVITEHGTCYNRIMEPAIKKMHGENVFDDIEKKIDSLYAENLDDRELAYAGGPEAIKAFLLCHLDMAGVRSDTEVPVVYVKLLVDTMGMVSQATIQKGHSAKLDNEAIRVCRMMTWIPAMENQKKRPGQTIIAVKFDKAAKSQMACD